jgi:hypothetical protein
MAQNTARGTPAKVLLLFALLTGAVAVSAWRDWLRRSEIERVTWPTALGDTDYHQAGSEPMKILVKETAYQLEEQPGEKLLRRDDEMFRVPLAVPLPRLYTISESWPADSVPPLYLKAAPGEYLRVALRKPGDF